MQSLNRHPQTICTRDSLNNGHCPLWDPPKHLYPLGVENNASPPPPPCFTAWYVKIRKYAKRDLSPSRAVRGGVPFEGDQSRMRRFDLEPVSLATTRTRGSRPQRNIQEGPEPLWGQAFWGGFDGDVIAEERLSAATQTGLGRQAGHRWPQNRGRPDPGWRTAETEAEAIRPDVWAGSKRGSWASVSSPLPRTGPLQPSPPPHQTEHLPAALPSSLPSLPG